VTLRRRCLPIVSTGVGIPLFDHLDGERIELEQTRIIETPGVTHVVYRVVKWASAPVVVCSLSTYRSSHSKATSSER